MRAGPLRQASTRPETSSNPNLGKEAPAKQPISSSISVAAKVQGRIKSTIPDGYLNSIPAFTPRFCVLSVFGSLATTFRHCIVFPSQATLRNLWCA